MNTDMPCCPRENKIQLPSHVCQISFNHSNVSLMGNSVVETGVNYLNSPKMSRRPECLTANLSLVSIGL